MQLGAGKSCEAFCFLQLILVIDIVIFLIYAFQELAELALGTYKHIGRIRCARLVGRDVASFYMLLGETQKAAAFLSDALRTFENDKWNDLIAQTQLELAECYKKAKDIKKLISTCAHVSTALEIDTLFRWTYFDEMRKNIEYLPEPLVVPFSDIIRIISVCVKNEDTFIQDSDIRVELVVESNFPREIMCTKLLISYELLNKENKKTTERLCSSRILTCKDMKHEDPMLQKLKMKKSLNYRQDKQLELAGIAAKFADTKRKDCPIADTGGNFNECLEANNQVSRQRFFNYLTIFKSTTV